MKRFVLTGTLVVLLAACGSVRQSDKNAARIPSVVRESFTRLYPDAKDVDWETEEQHYEASFEKDATEISVVLDANGHLLETETEISTEMLPKPALGYIATNYSGRKIKEAAKIIRQDGTIFYEAEVTGKDLLFDVNGAFIKVKEQ